MDKTDRNTAEDFCHPPGAVCTVGFQIKIGRPKFYAGEMISPA